MFRTMLIGLTLCFSAGCVVQESTSRAEDSAAKSGTTKGKEDSAVKSGTIKGKVDSTRVRRSAAVVYLQNVEGEFPAPEKKPLMDQRKLLFIPHVLPVLKGSTVVFPNNDTVRHNVFSPSRSAKQFNLGLYSAGTVKELKYEKVGVVPLLCNVHSEMSAFIVVLPNPYFATTEKDGSFTIENVPPGTYTLAFWHEKLRPKSAKVPVQAGKTTTVTFRSLKRGKYSVNLVK